MKQLLALALFLVFVLSLSACGSNDTPSVNDSPNSVVSDSTSDNEEWRQFLKDYEEWVDDYIEIVKKYESNPTDTSILSDYTEMVSEMADWSERADEIEQELSDTDAALEYSGELLKIVNKLSEVAK